VKVDPLSGCLDLRPLGVNQHWVTGPEKRRNLLVSSLLEGDTKSRELRIFKNV